MHTGNRQALYTIAILLQRSECQVVFKSNKWSTPLRHADSKISCVLDLFLGLDNYDEFRTELNDTLRRVLDPEDVEMKRKMLHPISSDRRHSLLLTYILKLGSRIDYQDSDGNTPILCSLLHPPMPQFIFREILETLIFENPEIQLNAMAVSVALPNDFKETTAGY